MNPSVHRDQLGLEQVRLLYAAMPISLTGTLINALALILVQWQAVGHSLLLGWLIVLLCITAARGVLTRTWHKQRPQADQAPRWRRYFYIGCVAAGLAWGSVSVLLFPAASIAHQVFLAFIVGGMCAGGSMTLNSDRRALFTFLMLAGIPLMVRFAMLGTTMGTIMALMVFLFLVLISFNALRVFGYTVQNIVLRLESGERERAVRLSEERLRESEQTYHGMFNSLEESVYIVDGNGSILDANDAGRRLSGYSRLELIGQSFELFSAPGRNDMAQLGERVFKAYNGESQHFEFCGRDAGGREFPMDMRYYPGEYFGHQVVIAVAQDISEKKKLEAQLLQAQKMESLGTLVGGIAHDFNNMLSGITGNLYMAKKHSKGRPKVLESLDKVENLSFQAADMVGQLLTFARKDQVDMRPLSLNAFIREACDLIRLSVPENVDMQSSFCSKELTVNGDATQLQQVLMNLLSNARDAVAGCDKPQIRLSTQMVEADKGLSMAHPALAGKRLIRLTVADNGTGIPRDRLENVFEPFFTTKDAGEGTGLGLAMVYGAVQSHGGVVQVESELGKGTSFHVYLPVCKRKEQPSAPSKPDEPPVGKGETILLVDDEEHVRLTGKVVLESLGYKVLQAVDGKAAVETFAAGVDEVSLVVLDVVMPHMGGVEAAKAIRDIRSGVPIIFTTGYDRNNALDLQAEGYYDALLGKPYRIRDMASAVQGLLDSERTPQTP